MSSSKVPETTSTTTMMMMMMMQRSGTFSMESNITGAKIITTEQLQNYTPHKHYSFQVHNYKLGKAIPSQA